MKSMFFLLCLVLAEVFLSVGCPAQATMPQFLSFLPKSAEGVTVTVVHSLLPGAFQHQIMT